MTAGAIRDGSFGDSRVPRPREKDYLPGSAPLPLCYGAPAEAGALVALRGVEWCGSVSRSKAVRRSEL